MVEIVAVLGVFRGGTSCVAGMLHHLGVPMGRVRKPRPANPRGFFEDEDLGQVCRRFYPEPWLVPRGDARGRRDALEAWIRGRAEADGPRIGIKHPTLCLMVDDLVAVCPMLRFIAVQRPLEESIASIRRLGWGWPATARKTVIPRMIAARDEALRRCTRPILRVEYGEIVQDPYRALDQIVAFCGIAPTAEQRRRAAEFVTPDLWRLRRA